MITSMALIDIYMELWEGGGGEGGGTLIYIYGVVGGGGGGGGGGLRLIPGLQRYGKLKKSVATTD